MKNNIIFNKINLYLRSLLIIILLNFIILLTLYSTIEYFSFNPAEIDFPTRSTKIYDNKGTYLWEISKDNSVKNTPVSINSIPQDCKNAIISIEDKNFWNNIGVDNNGMLRLIFSLFTNGSTGGGSTISQQVIKNLYQKIYNRNPIDKINEIIFSIKLNQYYSKNIILEKYLNNIYFGNLNYGIESASNDYFNKSSKELNLSECAYLMGIPQSPGIYNPYSDLEKGKTRMNEVLNSMVENKYISEQKKVDAQNYHFNFELKGFEVRAPHYIQYLQDKYGIMSDKENTSSIQNINFKAPLEITTYFDYDLYKKALDIVKKNINSIKKSKLNNSAVVILDKNGHLLSMVGSVDFFNDQINGKFNSALGLRQPGSVFIPLLYTLSFNDPIITSLRTYPNLPFDITILRDQRYQNIHIKNENQSSSLIVNLKDALNQNLIIPSTRMIQEVGINNILNQFNTLNIHTQQKKDWCSEDLLLQGCEITLYDLTQAYNILNTKSISKVADIYNINNGSNEIYKNKDIITQPSKELGKSIKEITSILNLKKQNGWFIQKGESVNFKDSFAIGYNSNYTVGVWSGNTQGEKVENLNSNDLSYPILKEIIQILN